MTMNRNILQKPTPSRKRGKGRRFSSLIFFFSLFAMKKKKKPSFNLGQTR